MLTTLPTSFSFSLAILFTVFTVGSILSGQHSEKGALEEFDITVSRNDTGLMLTCKEGCAWSELSFDLRPYQLVKIDNRGMTQMVGEDDETFQPTFRFLITKTDDGVQLQGIKGTFWTKLYFGLADNDSQGIDQSGMTD